MAAQNRNSLFVGVFNNMANLQTGTSPFGALFALFFLFPSLVLQACFGAAAPGLSEKLHCQPRTTVYLSKRFVSAKDSSAGGLPKAVQQPNHHKHPRARRPQWSCACIDTKFKTDIWIHLDHPHLQVLTQPSTLTSVRALSPYPCPVRPFGHLLEHLSLCGTPAVCKTDTSHALDGEN